MAFDPFEIVIEIKTIPPKAINDLAGSVDRVFKGDRGSDEDPIEFLHRKAQEFLAEKHERMFVQDRVIGSQAALEKEAREGMKIRQRKDKPVVINKLGENDPSMMPQPEKPAAVSKSKR